MTKLVITVIGTMVLSSAAAFADSTTDTSSKTEVSTTATGKKKIKTVKKWDNDDSKGKVVSEKIVDKDHADKDHADKARTENRNVVDRDNNSGTHTYTDAKGNKVEETREVGTTLTGREKSKVVKKVEKPNGATTETTTETKGPARQ